MPDLRMLESGRRRATEDSAVLRALESLAGVGPPVYGDDFNRADSSAPGLGAAWDGPDWYIASNHATRSGSTSDWARFLTDLGTPDHWVEVDIFGMSAGVSTYLVINARNSGALGSNAYLAFITPPTVGQNVVIGKQVSNSYSDVATGGSFAAASYKLRLEVEGTALRCYHNDVLALSTTDSSLTTGNYAGLNMSTGPPAGVYYDNFRCGPLPYTPP